jgi:RNA polymerase sigma-70 factor (ECF subfamily)
MGQEAEAGSVSSNREDLFRSAYRSHYRSVLAYALRRTAVRVDAEDVAAETFVVAWRRVGKLPTTEPDQLIWLYGVARRTLANHHRARGRAARLDALLVTVDPTDVPGADDGVVDHSDLKVAIEALSELSSKDQEVLLLALWEDLSTREIANVMDLSKPNVSLRLHRAKRRLRDRFAASVQEPSSAGHQTLRTATGDPEQEPTR